MNYMAYVYHRSDIYRFVVSPEKEPLSVAVSYGRENKPWISLDLTEVPQKVLNELNEQLCALST